MINYSGPIYEEILDLLDTFTKQDPDGEWNDEEWDTYARENASDNLKKYIDQKGKNWLSCESGEIGNSESDWDELLKD